MFDPLLRQCSYFLVLAPDAVHADTLLECNMESYGRRGWWCALLAPSGLLWSARPRPSLTPARLWFGTLASRLEQWSAATHGFSSMFCYSASSRLEPVTANEALRDAIFVFEGGAPDRPWTELN